MSTGRVGRSGRALRVLGVVALAALLWAGARLVAVERVLDFSLDLERDAARWSVEWTRDSDGSAHGKWLDLAEIGTTEEWLEIRPSGQARDPAVSFELWLYDVVPLRAPDDKPLLKDRIAAPEPGRVEGQWIPFAGGPGVVYVGREPGLLRLALPPGGVRVETAQTPRGGDVVLRYADREETLDLYGSTGARTVTLARAHPPAGVPLAVREALPAYALSALRLVAHGPTAGRVTVRDPRLDVVLLGIVVHRTALVPAPAGGVEGLAAEPSLLRFAGGGDVGRVDLAGRAAVPLGVHAIGVLLLALLVAALSAGARAARRLDLRHRATAAWPRWITAGVAAAALVVAVHFWMALWAPPMFAGDSPEYVLNAETLLWTHRTGHFGGWRLPGYSAFIAPFMLFPRFADAVTAAQGVLGVVGTWMCFDLARRFMPRGWAIATALVIGLDPVLLTHERYLLSETLSGFLVTLAVWLAWCRVDPSRPGVSAVAWAALAGVASAAAALVRGNLQTLVLVIPVLLALRAAGVRPLAGALRPAATALLVGALCLVPWLWRNSRNYGTAQLQIGTEFARVITAWDNGVLDENQSTIFSFDQWQAIRTARRNGTMNDLGFLDALSGAAGFTGAAAASGPVAAEYRDGEVTRESFARDPTGMVASIIAALSAQLGGWTTYRQSENVWLSEPFRGGAVPFETNHTYGRAPHLDPVRLEAITARSQRSIRYLLTSPNAQLFNELFWTFRLLRPVTAALFLVGLGMAVRERCAGIAGIGLVVVANALALAVFLMAVIDRYAVPSKGLLVVVAMYGVSRLARGRGERRAADPAAGRGGIEPMRWTAAASGGGRYG